MPARSWPLLLSTLLSGASLDSEDTAWAMDQVMGGEATPVEVAGFVVALRAKGETPDEVRGFVETMLARALRIEVPGQAVDTCGTGGDRAHTVNISTMSAMVVAACGIPVVKHGNRAASSRCGSADLLETLGVSVDLPPERVPECVADAGAGFCFAPRFHPALRHASTTRRELGVGTIFNFLGPLTNPAQPPAQAVGVSDARMAGVMADVLARRGTSALVFRGDDGLDELTTTTTSRVWVVRDGLVDEVVLDPQELGLPPAAVEDLRGGDADRNAAVTRGFLAGERGPVRDAVLLNAAAALAAAEPSPGPLVDRLRPALDRAADAVDTGAAGALLERWASLSTRLAQA